MRTTLTILGITIGIWALVVFSSMANKINGYVDSGSDYYIGKIIGQRALKPGGTFTSVKTTTKERPEDLEFLRGLLELRAIVPVIDRRYPLDEIRDAHRFVQAGHNRGNVVIDVA